MDKSKEATKMWVLGLLVGFVAIILFVPVRFRLRLKRPGRPLWAAEIAWAGNMLGAGWCVAGQYLFLGRRRWPVRLRRQRTATAAGLAGSERAQQLWRLATAERRRALGRLASSIWAAVAFSARGSVCYGFADPVLTAWLHAFICATGPYADFAAEADFTREDWEGQLEAECSLRPVRVLWPLIRFGVAWWRADKYKGGERLWQVRT